MLKVLVDRKLASKEYELASGGNPMNLSTFRVDKCQDWFCILQSMPSGHVLQYSALSMKTS